MLQSLDSTPNQEIDFDCACVACVRACVRAKLRERDDSAVARVGRTNLWGGVRAALVVKCENAKSTFRAANRFVMLQIEGESVYCGSPGWAA